MQRLQDAQNKLNAATIQLLAINNSLSKMLSDKATVASVTAEVEHMAKLVNDLVDNINKASDGIINGVPPLIFKLSAEGHYD